MPIELVNVSYVYSPDSPWEHRALSDVNLRIEDGDFLGIVGPTGSGKSTLIQHMNGLLFPTDGRVIVDGEEIGHDKDALRRLRRKVGMVFQYPEHQLFEETVEADIGFGPKNLELDPGEISERVRWAAEAVGLSEDILERSPFELSGGQMRRVAIAGVLAMRGNTLILDEPTSGLDPRGRASLVEQLRRLNSRGITMVMVSHSMEDMAQLANRMAVLSEGRIVMQGTKGEVFSRIEDLANLSLDVPRVTQVMIRLREAGLPLPLDIFTVDEGVEAVAAILEGDSLVQQ
ncbi:MAG: energy-coupling factor transporter ATPase [Clostridia bacterium]